MKTGKHPAASHSAQEPDPLALATQVARAVRASYRSFMCLITPSLYCPIMSSFCCSEASGPQV